MTPFLLRLAAGTRFWGMAALLAILPLTGRAAEGEFTRTDDGAQFSTETSGDQEVKAETEKTNAGEDDLGGAELSGGKPVAQGDASLIHETDTFGGENANVTYLVDAGAGGQVEWGKNGVQASGEVGFQAQLDALAKVSTGDEDFGGGAGAEAHLQALLKAQGQIGAYFDEKGLTIGAEAKAEALVSAEVKLSMNLQVFGVETTVVAAARGQAGASAAAQATVTIGFDGQVYFKVGAGATAGLGGKLSFEFAIGTADLMARLGLPSLGSLIEWCRQFTQDPESLAKALAQQAGQAGWDRYGDAVKQAALGAASEAAQGALSLARDVGGLLGTLPGGGVAAGMGGGLKGLFGGGLPSSSGFNSGMGEWGGSAGGGAASAGAGGGAGGSGGSSGGGSSEYKRFEQYKRWSR